MIAPVEVSPLYVLAPTVTVPIVSAALLAIVIAPTPKEALLEAIVLRVFPELFRVMALVPTRAKP